ncbi:alanine racemase [Thiosulfativibrio zosterae]|uniref:Alanine racemase n=1 Tax=Thiosulfativibrio zosterae TaxID=2675053 RepID=A0A6F8PNA9_9GAMM|nr:alanine racemase [Thiosulfativibrio zosterae]BBP43576.1 alanine racemase 1 [Thiosulfativibrio zosterae]
MMNYRPVKAFINFEALKSNLKQVRAFAPKSKILAVIKANGYGHGMTRVAEQLSMADAFGVASIDEAIKLRHKGFLHRILLLEGLFCESEFALVIQHRLDFVIHSEHQLDWLMRLNHSQPLNVWVKIDTGMHRLGFLPEHFPKVIKKLQTLKVQPNIITMSHFASAGESTAFTLEQLDCFNSLTQGMNGAKSLANSAAIQNLPAAHFDWVRPGIMLYGAGDLSTGQQLSPLKPVMTLKTEVTSLKWIEAGESVGYGQTWKATKKSFVGVLAVGYGDGYPRHAVSGTPVLVAGKRVPLIGRVSMDMITVDLTDLADSVQIGDEAILWGEGLPVDEVAKHASTIAYELLCGVTARVPIIEVRAS